ncbi:hypothetical protein [Hymenobacter yonginensis]|uniref:Uncharacterized protein n=1 Tax=Hymenobacter yonginensis TaxID=748197 RepID=A0ABY7PID3_9BACT|nr:hypothetical protein [Hymenobacter yonginensis]WBO83113.1 hypothetical protein O9Z63_12060 [Hymenobacter yonginensis]
MKGYISMALLSAAVLLGSCQSQQAFLFRPASSTYTAAAEPELLQPTAESAVVPELTAELPTSAVRYNAVRPARTVPTPLSEATATALALEPVTPAKLQLAPDTALIRPAADIPLRKIKETDLFTKLVRVVGVLVLLAAIALFITAFTTTSTGWTAFAFLLYGSTALLMSIPFFLFRGKDSPRRQELERRRAARKAAAG